MIQATNELLDSARLIEQQRGLLLKAHLKITRQDEELKEWRLYYAGARPKLTVADKIKWMAVGGGVIAGVLGGVVIALSIRR
jgi:hypothetical protein